MDQQPKYSAFNFIHKNGKEVYDLLRDNSKENLINNMVKLINDAYYRANEGMYQEG